MSSDTEIELRCAVDNVVAIALRRAKRPCSPSPQSATQALPTPGPSPKKRRRSERRSQTPSPEARAAVTAASAHVRTPDAAGTNSAPEPQAEGAQRNPAPVPPQAVEHDAQGDHYRELQRQVAESRAQVVALSRITLVDYDVAEATVYQMRGVLSAMMARIRRERDLVEGIVEEAGV